MNSFGTIEANSGDTILLRTKSKGNPAYSGRLERLDNSLKNEWDKDTLEDEGGEDEVEPSKEGYNVFIIPQLGSGQSITATLAVAGVDQEPQTITTNVSAGWTILVL